jgi:hypothetical protein
MTVDELIKDMKVELVQGEKPHKILSNLYSTLFDFRQDIYWIIGKLVKTYGPEIVFNAIIDLYDSEKNPEKNLYAQINSYCFKRKKIVSEPEPAYIDLNAYLMKEV